VVTWRRIDGRDEDWVDSSLVKDNAHSPVVNQLNKRQISFSFDKASMELPDHLNVPQASEKR
jgi:hypothetical protein